MANQKREVFKPSTVRSSSTSTSEGEGICDMCCHETRDWALGQCDHPICLRCCTKLRLLCEQKECSVCRLSLKKVLIVYQVKPYTSFTNVQQWRCDRKNGVFFLNRTLQHAYYSLMDNKCVKCSEPSFRTFKQLRDHMHKAHNLHYCDICTANLKLFPSEFKTYTRRDLDVHCREGDKDDTSHRGHPLCEFCGERYLDNDQLHAHLRKNHFWCHICENDGKQDYFKDYPSLRRHFRVEHFLCEEGHCKEEKFASVFRSKLDLQAHRAGAHTKGLSKSAVKQLKQLDVGFTYSREREEEEPISLRRPRFAGRGGDYITRGARGAQGRTRDQVEVVKPKLADNGGAKKLSSSSSTKTLPIEETKAPPGFAGQACTASGSTVPLAILSGGQGYEWGHSFDPYGGVTNLPETVNPTVSESSGLFSSTTCELLPFTNPPPGFSVARSSESDLKVETEWPDLSGGGVPTSDLFPPRMSEQPILCNITSAVMNANQNQLRVPNLQSESSFPCLGSNEMDATSPNDTSPLALQTLNPVHSEQSKLLKLAVAATTSTDSRSHGWSIGTRPNYQAAAQLDSFNLSSQNFPLMSAAPVTDGSSSVVSGITNQNNYVPSEKPSSSTEASLRKSRQSQIIEKVRKTFDYDRERFTHFKTLMGWYKNGEITVEEFKAQCLRLFGNKWKEIGPELAEMMPSHEKKNELLSSFGIRSASRKNMATTTKSRRKSPVTVSSVWGVGPMAPVCNFNTISTGLSHDEYPTLGSAMNQSKTVPQPTPWNVVI